MTEPERPRILIVDDEEAILETMTFTFMDLYEVFTTSDPTKALGIMEENQPIAVVITDQRMPGMTGVELLREVYERFPETVRIILTGFADSEATIKAINDGHIYGYVNKPWEPDELKRIVSRATDLNKLTVENQRLVEDLRNANLFLGAVMDRLRTGAIAVDRDGIVRAVNQPALAFMGLEKDIHGCAMSEVFTSEHHKEISEKIRALSDEREGEPSREFEELDIKVGAGHRLRISSQTLSDETGEEMGRVVLFKEISHEPLTRDFETIVDSISGYKAEGSGEFREELERSLPLLAALGERVTGAQIESANMSELGQRVSRAQTAISSWLDVDEILASEEFPDAQLLRDRMKVAGQRWARSDALPERVVMLGARVEDYYESGENNRERTL
ncbi:MAG: response regulator [Myxococcota bacterium]